MSIRLLQQPVDDGSISVCQLKDDQVAEIVGPRGVDRAGHIVKRNTNHLVGISFSGIWYISSEALTTCKSFRVKVLPNRSRLEIVDNE